MSYLFLLGLTITLLSFSNGHQHQLKCWKMEMTILGSDEGKGLITEEEILEVCNEANKGVIGKTSDQIDIPNLKRNLQIQPYVRHAEVYQTLDGRCRIEVLARTPIARILDSAGTSSYMDEEGFLMPLKEGYSADVPLFVGQFRCPMLTQSVLTDGKATSEQKDILNMALVIKENETWDAQVDHLVYSDSKGWMMIPRVGRNIIRIDKTENFKKKMENLFVFYSKVMPHVDLDLYDTLDARFINQIVGIKRNITL